VDEIKRLEFVLVDGLRFHLSIRHPYTALHGIFLDAQSWWNPSDTTETAPSSSGDRSRLLRAYRHAAELVWKRVYVETDLVFTMQPSQLAMGLFVVAMQEDGEEFVEKYKVKHTWCILYLFVYLLITHS
jgi:cyclin H